MLFSVQGYVNDANQSTPGGKEFTEDCNKLKNAEHEPIHIQFIMDRALFLLKRSRRGEKFSLSFLSLISKLLDNDAIAMPPISICIPVVLLV